MIMCDLKDIPIPRKDYTKIFKELEEFCKKHDISFSGGRFLTVWVEGHYVTDMGGSFHHSALENFGNHNE